MIVAKLEYQKSVRIARMPETPVSSPQILLPSTVTSPETTLILVLIQWTALGLSDDAILHVPLTEIAALSKKWAQWRAGGG